MMFIVLVVWNAGIDLCIISILMTIILLLILVLFIHVGSSSILVVTVVVDVLIDDWLHVRLVFVIRRILELTAVEVVLNEQEATVLDFLWPFNGWRLGVTVFLDFRFRLYRLATFWSRCIILRWLLGKFGCVHLLRTLWLSGHDMIHSHGTLRQHPFTVTQLRHLPLDHLLMRLAIVNNLLHKFKI